MRIYIEIFSFSDGQAHGAINILDIIQPDVTIPFSMPLQSFQTAVDNQLIASDVWASGESDKYESTIFSDGL